MKKLFEENISKLNSVPPTINFSKLPDELKVKAVFHGIKRAMDGPQFEDKPTRVDRIKDILDASKLLLNEHINPETFSETGSNPNSGTVKEKFKEVGVKNIFDLIKSDFVSKWGQPISDNFIADKLDEIVRTRHVVAHTADTLHITRKTQNDSIRFIKILAEILQRNLDNHFKSLMVAAKK